MRFAVLDPAQQIRQFVRFLSGSGRAHDSPRSARKKRTRNSASSSTHTLVSSPPNKIGVKTHQFMFSKDPGDLENSHRDVVRDGEYYCQDPEGLGNDKFCVLRAENRLFKVDTFSACLKSC